MAAGLARPLKLVRPRTASPPPQLLTGRGLGARTAFTAKPCKPGIAADGTLLGLQACAAGADSPLDFLSPLDGG